MRGLQINRTEMTQLWLCVFLMGVLLADLGQAVIYTDGKTSVEWVTHGPVAGARLSGPLAKDVTCYVYNDPEYTPRYPNEGLLQTDSITASNMVQECLQLQGSRSPEYHRIRKRSLSDVLKGIYPGTKWCGRGNIAYNQSQVGKHGMADSCCMAHDNCANFIRSGERKYGIYNSLPYTVSSCACDDRFKECLQSTNDSPSRVIGAVFFNVAKVPCIEANIVYRGGVPVGLKAKLVRAKRYEIPRRNSFIRWLGGLFGK